MVNTVRAGIVAYFRGELEPMDVAPSGLDRAVLGAKIAAYGVLIVLCLLVTGVSLLLIPPD